MPNFVRRCVSCDVRKYCVRAFGKFFADRSSNGQGCQHPLTVDNLYRKKLDALTQTITQTQTYTQEKLI